MNVISFSLWGNKKMYWHGAEANAKLAKYLFPGWICRYYVDKTCDKDNIDRLKGENVEIVLMESSSSDNYSGMFWRFLAASDDQIETMLSRDCDSRLTERDRLLVQMWLESDKDFHIIRDHPYHTVPILGGLWGCRNNILKDMSSLIGEWSDFEVKGCDQVFLEHIVYPIVDDNSLVHDFTNVSDCIQYPIRFGSEFVGDVYDEYNYRNRFDSVFSRRLPHIQCVVLGTKYLNNAINNFYAQDYPNKELLVLNDKYTDLIFHIDDQPSQMYRNEKSINYIFIWDSNVIYFPWFLSQLVQDLTFGNNNSHYDFSYACFNKEEITHIEDSIIIKNNKAVSSIDNLKKIANNLYSNSSVTGFFDYKQIPNNFFYLLSYKFKFNDLYDKKGTFDLFDPWENIYHINSYSNSNLIKKLKVYKECTFKYWLYGLISL